MSATMNMTIATRVVACVALARVLLAAAITLNDRRHPATPAWKTELSLSTTALGSELARCKAMGAEAANDAACKAVWDSSRKHFFESGKLYRDRVTGAARRRPAENAGQPQ